MKVNVQDIKVSQVNSEIYSLSSIEELMDSIKILGLLQKPVINKKTNHLLSGHRRIEALKRLGIKTVEVDCINVNEDDEILYLIHYNQTRVKSVFSLLMEYDFLKKYYKKNKSKIQSRGLTIRKIVSDDMNLSDGQLARLLTIRKHSPQNIELIDKGILSINQAYLITQRNLKDEKTRIDSSINQSNVKGKNFRFYQKSSDNLKELKNSEVDLIITSPPFWKLRSYSVSKGLGDEDTPDDYVENLVKHIHKECWRVLSKQGSFFLELGDSYLNGSVQNIPHKVAIKLQELGWMQRNSIVCHRSNPRPSSSKNNLTNTYSMMFHFTKSMDYRYERTLTKISSNTKPSHPPRHRSSDGSTVKSLTPYLPNIEGKNIGDFLSDDILRTAVSNQKNYNGIKEHPAQFPEQLVWLVLNSVCVLPYKDIPTNTSPLVLDIFGGSLSVNRVIQMINKMENTNIRFVGYDIKKWF
jgi:DNA modification methylase